MTIRKPRITAQILRGLSGCLAIAADRIQVLAGEDPPRWTPAQMADLQAAIGWLRATREWWYQKIDRKVE